MADKYIQNVFIIGSKGIPGAYGGYETFVDKLTEYHQNNSNIKYHVACKATQSGEFEYHNARCFKIKVPEIGAAQAIYYDVEALKVCCKYIQEKQVKDPVVYVLACRIGPFFAHYVEKIHALGGKVFVNPDGHEFLRGKWPLLVRKYWKLSEKLMVKSADLIICDSKNIERYIKETYKKFIPETTYIAYGADVTPSKLGDSDKRYLEWMRKNGLRENEYYLIVGRFVPENNFETMISEFMKSSSKKDLAIITTVNNSFLKKLQKKLQFKRDKRIKFVGTLYDQELLKKVREKAYGYLHGHEVGGTNPSLLEALSSTKLNLLLDVGFNREVAEDAALYWNKEDGNLANLINSVDRLNEKRLEELGHGAQKRIVETYKWDDICNRYDVVFMWKNNF